MNLKIISSKIASSIPRIYFNALAVIFGLFLTIIVSIADYSVGSEISFSIFYTIPVAYFTWYFNYPLGIIDCFINAFIWGFVDFTLGNTYSHPLIPIWNVFVRLGFFVIIASLLSKVKQLLEIEKKLSRTDYLTGAINSRYFFEILESEIERSRRYNHPFTLAYIDVDNFKFVNDNFGHEAGDKVLCLIVNSIKNNLRIVDQLSRVGGDEFILFLPETDQTSSKIVIEKVRSCLLDEMDRMGWPVTFIAKIA